MKLKAYLSEKGMTLKDFADLIEVTPRYLTLINKGECVPSKKLSKRIEYFTEGCVKIPSKTKKKSKTAAEKEKISEQRMDSQD